MLQIIFGSLMGISLIYALVRGQGADLVTKMIESSGAAVKNVLSMAGGYAFFCGFIGILRAAGAIRVLSRFLSPFLGWLMGPELPGDALDYVTMNLTANLLGMGNAATPMGVEAAKRMAHGDLPSNALCLFLVINASSVQLIPSTVITLRAAAGSTAPGSIAWPTLIATLISTLTGVIACKWAEGKK